MKKLSTFILLAIVVFFENSTVYAIDHQLFDQVLKAHVADGVVNYPAIQEDSRYWDYLDYLAETNPDSFPTREEKLAFWINAYNALAIKGILDGQRPSGFLSRIHFFTKNYNLAGDKIDLYDLERKIIIPFGEPRIHFAIVCSSSSCPKLISEAYSADKLDLQLDKSARLFINNMDKNQFDINQKVARVSKIFDWFPEDFINHSETVQQYLGSYIDDPAIAESLLQNQFKLKYLNYDWSLNGENPA
jgi:hypothetical protein